MYASHQQENGVICLMHVCCIRKACCCKIINQSIKKMIIIMQLYDQVIEWRGMINMNRGRIHPAAAEGLAADCTLHRHSHQAAVKW